MNEVQLNNIKINKLILFFKRYQLGKLKKYNKNKEKCTCENFKEICCSCFTPLCINNLCLKNDENIIISEDGIYCNEECKECDFD